MKLGASSSADPGRVPGLAPVDPCPACVYLAEMEDTALVALTDALPGKGPTHVTKTYDPATRELQGVEVPDSPVERAKDLFRRKR